MMPNSRNKRDMDFEVDIDFSVSIATRSLLENQTLAWINAAGLEWSFRIPDPIFQIIPVKNYEFCILKKGT
jgi:hypothetical protein